MRKKIFKGKCKLRCCDKEILVMKLKLCSGHAQRYYKTGKIENKKLRKKSKNKVKHSRYKILNKY